MKCSVCGGYSKVQSSHDGGNIVARRRKCKECDHIFYTIERESSDGSRIFRELEKNYLFNLKAKKENVEKWASLK